MKQTILTGLAAFILSVSAMADDDNIAELWECKLSGEVDWNELKVIASVENGHKKGSLWAAGVDNKSLYQVQGLNRIWSFSPNEKGEYNYTFIITASNKGKFYDFSEATDKPLKAATKVMDCRLDD